MNGIKEWIRKIIASIVIFILIFVILYNIVEIDITPVLPEGAVVLHEANKIYAVTSLSFIVSFAILEVIQIVSYINGYKTPNKKMINLIKLLTVTVILGGLSIFAYFVYSYTSVTVIDYINNVGWLI